MTLEHLGIAVADPEAAIAIFEQLLGKPPYKVETVEREGVRTIFFGDDGAPHAAPKLELLDALTPESPVATYLDRRGPGLHHVAFEVADIESEMARLAGLGYRLLADRPKPGADGKRIVFLHPKSTAGVLVELCETVWSPERVDVPFQGGTLATHVSGPPGAPPLVVLHGALDTSAGEVAPLARRWAGRFRVHALDFPAHGSSDAFAGLSLTTGVLASAVERVLDALDLASTALYGYSLGGAVALHVAARRPERVSRLAVHAAHVQWRDEEVTAMNAEADAALAAPDPTWRRTLAAAHGEEHWPTLVRRMRAFEHASLDDEVLAQLHQPTFVSVGDRDRFLEAALHLHATLPAASLAVLPATSHQLSARSRHELSRYADAVAEHLGENG